MLDSEQWTETSTEVLAKPAVQNALANYLVDQLFTSVDVEQELKDQLPGRLGRAGEPRDQRTAFARAQRHQVGT